MWPVLRPISFCLGLPRAQRAVHAVRLRALSLVPLHFLMATQVYAALNECEAEWGEEQGLSR